VVTEELNRLTKQIIGAALRIHSALGPGLFESVYEIVLARDLARRGLSVERQKPVTFEFDGMHFKEGFKADLVVGRAVIVEVKSVSEVAPVHCRQLLTYLRLMNYRVGLILNFNTVHLKDGIKRVAN
jgi:iron complex transport system substrate-binding protein